MKQIINTKGTSKFLSELKSDYSNYALKVRSMAAETVEGHQIYVDRLLTGLKITSKQSMLSRITPKTVSKYIVKYSKCHGHGSTDNMTSTMRSFLNYCWHYGLLDQNLSNLIPTSRKREMSHIPKAIDDQSISLLLEEPCPSSPATLRDSAILALLATYGVRGVQVRKLLLSDIDWDKEEIHFPIAKNGTPITQPITPFVGECLAKYLSKGRPGTHYDEVFLIMNNGVHPLDRAASLSQIIRRRIKRCGISIAEGVPLGSHGFRHAFAIRNVGEIPFEQLANMMGHRSLRSTLLYSKVSFSKLAEAALPWPEEE